MISVKQGIIAAGAVIAFSLGWYFNGLRWETKFYDLSIELSAQLNEAQQKVLESERTIAQLISSTEHEVSEHENQIDADYHGLLDNIEHDSLYESAYSSADYSLPAASAPSCPLCPCDDRYYAERRRAFNDLQKQVLDYTKKCDETIIRYNSLINFYESLRKEVNKSD